MYYIILSFLYLSVFIFFLPANITSSDGGELVTSAFLSGVAHPSGYPFYVILTKLVSFFPLGTVAFRFSLFSSLFAVVSLIILYKIIFLITKHKYSALFATFSLFLSYSFFYNSIVQKFYTLNLTIILYLTLLGIEVIIKGYNRKIQFLIFFILGLTTGNHHTALFMVIPFIIIAFLYFKLFLKNFLISFIFFLAGSFINFYVFIRLKTGSFTLFPVNFTLKSIFYEYIFRGIYETSSIQALKSAYSTLDSYFYSFINCLKIIQVNFPLYFTFLFFITSVVILFLYNKKLFFFLITCFLSYSLLLAKLTFSEKEPSIMNYYIVANQYFLPMLGFFALFSSIGFYYTIKFLRKKSMVIYKLFLFLPVFYWVVFPIRFNDNMWSENLVPYQAGVDRFFTKPINSIYLTTGDNPIFETLYLKKIANFRNDICQIAISSKKGKNVPIDCFIKNNTLNQVDISHEHISEIFKKQYNKFFPVLFSSKNLDYFFSDYYFSPFLSDFLIFNESSVEVVSSKKEPNEFYKIDNEEKSGIEQFQKKGKINTRFLSNLTGLKKTFKAFFYPYPCLHHSTDDFNTIGICSSVYIANGEIDGETRFKLLEYNNVYSPYVEVDKNLRKKYMREKQ